MLIAFICVVVLLLVFVLITFLITNKTFVFDVEGGKLKVQNKGSHLKIYFNENLLKDVFSPQLFNGEKVEFKINNKDYNLVCKCNKLGNKFKVEVFSGEELVASNGVEL